MEVLGRWAFLMSEVPLYLCCRLKVMSFQRGVGSNDTRVGELNINGACIIYCWLGSMEPGTRQERGCC